MGKGMGSLGQQQGAEHLEIQQRGFSKKTLATSREVLVPRVLRTDIAICP